MSKKILSLSLIVITLCSVIITSNVYAATENEKQETFLVNEIDRSVNLKNSALPTSNITSQYFLLYYDNFRVYNPTEFSQFQYGNNWGITFVANVLSYFKRLGFNLYSGEITQAMYDDIASLTNYSPSEGTRVYKLFDAIETYAKRAGYKAETTDYLLDLWSDVTRDIKLGYPVLAANKEHGYMVVGYRIIDGVKQLYVVTNQEGANYEWINFDGANFQMRSYNITY